MTDRERTLIQDARLSREARLMGLYIAGEGDDWTEVSTEDWQRLLGRSQQGGTPTRRTISHYASELVTWGWIEKKPGGAGSPRYRFLPGSQSHTEALRSSQRHAERNGSVAPRDTQDPATGPPDTPKASPPPLATTSSSASVAREAEEAIERFADALAGCRGALRDYLLERVPPDRQLAYVQTLVGTIQGTDEWAWTDGTGSKVPPDERPTVVAGCLNELRLGDEVGQYFPQPPGGFKNLRSKIRYKAKAKLGSERDAKDTTPSPTPKANRPQNARPIPDYPEDERADDAA